MSYYNDYISYYKEATKSEYDKYQESLKIPTIVINDYQAKFYKDVVSFGCQDINIETIREIARLQNSLHVDLTKEANNIAAIVKHYNTNKVTQEKDDLPF